MLKGLKPPTHRADFPGEFVFAHDSAWDLDRLDAELSELVDLALQRKRQDALDAACSRLGVEVDALPTAEIDAAAKLTLSDDEAEAARATHPVRRYYAGATRYQLDAPDQGPRGPACAGDYLREGVAPTSFTLRRIPLRERVAAESIRDPFARWVRWIKAGVARVATGEDLKWEAAGRDDALPDEWIEAIADSTGGPTLNLITLAGACAKFSAPLTEPEGKR